MAKSVLSDARFHNEAAAFAYVEAELWPNGPVCPHCGNTDGAKIGRLQGKMTRPGLYKCYAAGCRKPFTVRIGTIFEDSHLALNLWLQAIHLMCASKKGISTRQLQRILGCGLKTAWHLGHRIRHAMAPATLVRLGGLGNTALAVDEECEGVVEGMLEQINLHHDANVFYIYPEVGPRKVTCHFPARLYDDAVSAVGRRVEVSGTLHYRSGATFPHQVAVTAIDVFPPESELPDWDDLRGRAPDATGGMSSEAFVRELRNGWR